MANILQANCQPHYFETVRISIETSLKFVHKYSINNIPAMVLIMAGHRPGDIHAYPKYVLRDNLW